MAVAAFDEILGQVKPWVALAKEVSPEVGEGAALVEAAFTAQRDYIEKAVSQKKPSEDKAMELIGPTSEKMGALAEHAEKHDRGAYGKALKTLGEGISALAWVVTTPPVPHVKETTQACLFYGNKVISEQKGKDDKQVQFIKDWKAILEALAAYVKEYHTTGVAWNSAAGGGGGGGGGGGAAAAPAPAGASVEDYDQWLKNKVLAFVEASKAVAPEVGDMAAILENAFSQQRAFLAEVAECKKPDDDALSKALAPQVEAMERIAGYQTPAMKRSAHSRLFQAIEESGQAVAWVASPTPIPHVAEIASQAQFHVNKALQAPTADAGTKAFGTKLRELYAELQEYVKAHHRGGLGWNPKGKALTGAPKGAPPPASKPAAAPAPAPAPAKKEAPKAPKATPKPAAAPKGFPTGTAKKELEGKKWNVEYFTGSRSELTTVEVDVERSQTLYVYACQYTFIKVKGKINAINLYKCKKVQLQFESCIGQLEITDVEGAEVQVLGQLPAVTIDKSTEVMLYISKESLEVDITTCASTNVNVTVPGKTAEDDPVELQIAEQFSHKVVGNKVESNPVEHSS
eukprot:Hpha_TRINITY_DN16023_c7_g1::TRINITY_DN16023_c7_g1_i2::g.120022::m.120022/K17261/CAP1_2, SRV2; adenylyl cyclase-associated protein